MRRLSLLSCLPLLFGASKAPACPPDASPGRAAETVRAVEIRDGGVLLLSDGREVRLVPAAVPRRTWRGRTSIAPLRRLASRAREQLRELVSGRDLVLADREAPDRYGRIRAQVFRTETDGSRTWIQAELVRAGLARVESQADARRCAKELLRLEAEAREESKGIWRLDLFAVRTPEQARRHAGSWQIVEGRIKNVSEVRGRTYVNFGANWRTDFTISIGARAARRFPDGFWKDKTGRRVRVRGQVERWHGPMIEATHPEQMEWPEGAGEKSGKRREKREARTTGQEVRSETR